MLIIVFLAFVFKSYINSFNSLFDFGSNIDVDSSKVSYNQLNAINILANKLKDQEIKYSANKSTYKIELTKITKLHPNEILFLLYLQSTIIGYGLIRKHEIIKNAVLIL